MRIIKGIGRALKRIIRILFKTALALIVLSIITYAALNIWYYSGEVKITRDVVAELTETARNSAPDDRAWPLYRQAMLTMDPLPFPKGASLGPEHPRWDLYVEEHERHREQVDLLLLGSSRPILGYIPGAPIEGPGLRSERRGEWETMWARQGVANTYDYSKAVMPTLSVLRTISRVFVLDALIAEALGDGERCADNIVAMINLADQVREFPLVICDIVSLGTFNHARQLIDDTLHRSPDLFTDVQLDRLETALLGYMGGRIRGRVDVERAILDDYVQRSFTDNGKGSGHLIRPRPTAATFLHGGFTEGRKFSLLGPLELLYKPSRRQATEAFNEIYIVINGLVERPYNQLHHKDVIGAYDNLTFGARGSIHRKVPFLSLFKNLRWNEMTRMMPVLGARHYYAAHHLLTFRRDQTLTVIALIRFHREHERWPETLDELVPDYTDHVLIDIFDDKPVRYFVDEDTGEPVLYSVGANLEDDKGVYVVDEHGRHDTRDTDRWFGDREMIRRQRANARTDWQKKRLLPAADFILWPPISPTPVDSEN